MTEFSPRTADPFAEVKLSDDKRAVLDEIKNQLIQEGEQIDQRWVDNQFNDTRIFEGLSLVERQTGIPLKEYVRHSSRYARLTKESILGEMADIPESPDNVHSSGQARRHESGKTVELRKVQEQGGDPSKILYYRATQPSYLPKPEYYWTSDSVEAKGGLMQELGPDQAATAVVLVSSLAQIAGNSGLIQDINDDQGIAVRQRGFESYSQAEALFAFSRDPVK